MNTSRKSLRPALLALALLLGACAPPEKVKILIKMMPAQEEYFQKTIAPAFEKKYKVKMKVVHFENVEDLPQLLRAADAAGGVNLVKVPFELTRSLVGKNLILPVDSVVTPEELQKLKSEYFLMDLVKIDQKYYYLPRKFETRMLIYLKSEVRDAVKNWAIYKDEIQETLARHNGVGLPVSYRLEGDPNEWDYFDLFVAGTYWKNRDLGGQRMPRIAVRGRRYSGTALGLIDHAYSQGASARDVLRMDSDPVVDMLQWETIFVQENIYNPRMYEEGWSGTDIQKGFKSGEVFLSFMTQIDAFFIHGTGTAEMPGNLQNPEDMGVAVMPKGVSLELVNGEPARQGRRAITTGGWWWGIPRNTPSRDLSFKLAHFITNTENQIEECSSFGMVPVRQDILSELGLMFGGGWISDVFHVASQQLVENKYTVIPLVDEYDQVGVVYMDAFYDIAVKGTGMVDGRADAGHIRGILQNTYVPKEKAILKDKYPPAKTEVEKKPEIKEKFQALDKNLE